MRRRTLLRRGAIVGAAGLAGCLGQSGGGSAPTTEPPADGTESPTMAATDEPMSASPTATEPSTPTPSPTAMDGRATATASPTPSPTATASAARTVAVGPGGSLRFDPASFEIAAGETVRWAWDSSGHNVKPSATPGGADWAGTPGEEFRTFSSGHTYAYTFDVAGEYEYYCAPHRSSGMTGSFTVREGGGDINY